MNDSRSNKKVEIWLFRRAITLKWINSAFQFPLASTLAFDSEIHFSSVSRDEALLKLGFVCYIIYVFGARITRKSLTLNGFRSDTELKPS